MSRRADTLRLELTALPADLARIAWGNRRLDELYRDLIRAYAPPNVQYERERIISQISNAREIVFVLGLLSEGENEAALLLELIATLTTAEPGAPIAHLIDEAWYYLRTSIDETWQLDAGPSTSAALVYLVSVLSERLDAVRALPASAPLAARDVPGRAELLRSLRAELGAPSAARN